MTFQKPFKIHHSKTFSVSEQNTQGMFLALHKCLDSFGISAMKIHGNKPYVTPIDNDPTNPKSQPLMLVHENCAWNYFDEVSLHVWCSGNRNDRIFCFLGFVDPREQDKPIAVTFKLHNGTIIVDYYGDSYQAKALLEAVSELIGLDTLLVPRWWTLPGIVYEDDRFNGKGLLWDTDLKETIQMQPSQKKFQNIEQALCQFEVDLIRGDYHFTDIRNNWALETFSTQDQLKIKAMMKTIHGTALKLQTEARELMESLPRPKDYLTGNQIGVIKA